jgi:nucleoside phosphorylase
MKSKILMSITVAVFAVLFSACEKEVAITGIAIDPGTLTLTEEGQTDTLTATLAPADAKGTIVWASSNTAVATVTGDGLTAIVTAVGNGTAKITATADIFTAECAVTVNIGNGGGGDGEGTEEAPYSVEEAIANQGGLKWVEGYIVGYVNGLSIDAAAFALPTEAQTEILIAKSATETNAANCLPVQLPSGSVRTGLELFANPSNLGKSVKLYGSLEAYFGQPGMRSTSYYELEGGATGGTKPVDTTGALLNETLLTQTSFDKFATQSVTGAQVWTFSSSYGAVMTGYLSGTSYANEDWLISPAIDLTGKTNAKLSFEHARGPAGSINVGVSEGYYTVWVSNNYNSGAPSTATWTEITGVVHGTAAWGYVSSGQLSIPTANLAPNAKIAFKYLSIDGASATWEIKNVLVK